MPTQPSPKAKEDYNALLNWLMPFAEDMLKKHGEFFPFGAAVAAVLIVTFHWNPWPATLAAVAAGFAAGFATARQ